MIVHVVVANSYDLDEPWAECAFPEHEREAAFRWAKEQNENQSDRLVNYNVSSCDVLFEGATHKQSFYEEEDDE
jgi:hypothetical protein